MVGFGVDMNAPRFPFVVPTLLWRKCVKPVWMPIRAVWGFFYEDGGGEHTARATRAATAATAEHVRRFATKVLSQAQQTWEAELSMNDDEVI
jgi:hypothetical protein